MGLVEVCIVVRKSFIKLKVSPTKEKKKSVKPASYYVSLICFGDVLNSSGEVARVVIEKAELDAFKKEFFSCLQKVGKAIAKSISEDEHGFQVSDGLQRSSSTRKKKRS